MTEIPAVGVVRDLPAEDYHRHDSLSSSGARKLLSTCPAAFRFGRQEHKPEFDMGHAAHKLVLGDGPELVEVEYKDWRTRDAQNQRDAAYAKGQVPLLTKDLKTVHAMAAAILREPLAARVLSEPGDSELSVFWEDFETGAPLRCRPDRLTSRWAVDYKTCDSAHPDDVAKSMHKWGYYMQQPFYLDGLVHCDLAEPDLPFLFIFQEKTPPYLVTVAQLRDGDAEIGREKNRMAIEMYAHCRAADSWPGYSDDVVLVSLPAWAA